MKRKKLAQLLLGLIIPLTIVTSGLGYFLFNYATLPARITIHFNTSRVPTTSLPIMGFTIMMVTILLIATIACSLVAFSKKVQIINNHKDIASYGTFFSVVVSTLLVGTTIIHKNLNNWQDATGPGWYIVIPIILGFGFSFIAIKLAKIYSF